VVGGTCIVIAQERKHIAGLMFNKSEVSLHVTPTIYASNRPHHTQRPHTTKGDNISNISRKKLTNITRLSLGKIFSRVLRPPFFFSFYQTTKPPKPP
jgi:hypothetical protein